MTPELRCSRCQRIQGDRRILRNHLVTVHGLDRVKAIVESQITADAAELAAQEPPMKKRRRCSLCGTLGHKRTTCRTRELVRP